MKRITASALALVMVATLVICSGFTLRDKSADEAEVEKGEEAEGSTFWEKEIEDSVDDFGDHTFWAYAEGRTQTSTEYDSPTGNDYANVGVFAVPADIALADDRVTTPVFTFLFTNTDGESIFTSRTITLKIKVLNEEYEASLIEAAGSYTLVDYGINEDFYDEFVKELGSEKDINCVVVSNDIKIRFDISGEGYSDAMEEVDDYNKNDAWAASWLLNDAIK